MNSVLAAKVPLYNLEALYHASPDLVLPSSSTVHLDVRHGLSTDCIPTSAYHHQLKQTGLLIINLEGVDPCADLQLSSDYFQRILSSIGALHTHDGKSRAVWEVKVGGANGQENLARSHRMSEFTLHTDCSYETLVPDHIALFVMKADRLGGGNNLLVNGLSAIQQLSPQSLRTLQTEKFRIRVPAEFKKTHGPEYIDATLIDAQFKLRYRREIIEVDSLSQAQQAALTEWEELIYSPRFSRRLTLKAGQILILNNQAYLHARTEILDKSRHLQRVRFFLHSSVA